MKFKRPRTDSFDLQLIPLIDVIFFLLAFFMISTTFIDHDRAMDVELPQSKAGSSTVKSSVFEIDMTVDNKLYLNGQLIQLDALPSLLAQSKAAGDKRSAIIRADKRVNHGEVVKVMEACKEAAIADIGVAVQ
ncbi:MAG: biopolymer transporter ExbD [Nitrospinae bacterium]|nr:biopolymer transporter ExbD [Nitrospinota bacterium]